jgi:hypothetical protein
MGYLVDLPSRRFEENGSCDTTMDVFEGPFGIGIQRFRVGRCAGYVGIDGSNQARFPELA